MITFFLIILLVLVQCGKKKIPRDDGPFVLSSVREFGTRGDKPNQHNVLIASEDGLTVCTTPGRGKSAKQLRKKDRKTNVLSCYFDATGYGDWLPAKESKVYEPMYSGSLSHDGLVFVYRAAFAQIVVLERESRRDRWTLAESLIVDIDEDRGGAKKSKVGKKKFCVGGVEIDAQALVMVVALECEEEVLTYRRAAVGDRFRLVDALTVAARQSKKDKQQQQGFGEDVVLSPNGRRMIVNWYEGKALYERGRLVDDDDVDRDQWDLVKLVDQKSKKKKTKTKNQIDHVGFLTRFVSDDVWVTDGEDNNKDLVVSYDWPAKLLATAVVSNGYYYPVTGSGSLLLAARHGGGGQEGFAVLSTDTGQKKSMELVQSFLHKRFLGPPQPFNVGQLAAGGNRFLVLEDWDRRIWTFDTDQWSADDAVVVDDGSSPPSANDLQKWYVNLDLVGKKSKLWGKDREKCMKKIQKHRKAHEKFVTKGKSAENKAKKARKEVIDKCFFL